MKAIEINLKLKSFTETQHFVLSVQIKSYWEQFVVHKHGQDLLLKPTNWSSEDNDHGLIKKTH